MAIDGFAIHDFGLLGRFVEDGVGQGFVFVEDGNFSFGIFADGDLSIAQGVAGAVRLDLVDDTVELLPLGEAWKLIEQRLTLFGCSLAATTGSLPDILHDPDEFWECDFCPVRGMCERLHGAPVGAAALRSLVSEEAA